MKDFQYYKNWAINHLKKQLVEENAVKKSLYFCELLLQKSFPVGTIREWKGKKYKKVAPGKWMRYYNSQNRGSAQAIRYAIKQLEKIEDIETLAKFINQNRSRFCNEYGKPLPEAEEILRLGKEKGKEIKYNADIEDIKTIASVLDNGISKEVTSKNPKVDKVTIDKGKLGKKGYGLLHIIQQRYIKDNYTEDEITALLCLLPDILRKGNITRDVAYPGENGIELGMYDLEKKGIISYIAKTRGNKLERFVITEYDNFDKQKEATDSINAVIAKYRYTPEFIIVKKQVGAVLSSLNSNLTPENKNVNEKSVNIEPSDFPEAFNKGKWKKQTKLFMDYLNKQSQAIPMIKNVYKYLGKFYNKSIPFYIHNTVKKFNNGLECFAVSTINEKDPVEQKLYYTPNFENEDLIYGETVTLLHELMHMIDFSVRENQTEYGFRTDEAETLVSAINNAKISEEEMTMLKTMYQEVKDKKQGFYDEARRINKILKDLGRSYGNREITWETYSAEYDEKSKLFNELRNKIEKVDHDNRCLYQLCDVYDAITKGQIHDNENMPGHGVKYYTKTEENRAREIVACIASIGVMSPFYIKTLEKYQPELVKAVYNFYEELNRIGENK